MKRLFAVVAITGLAAAGTHAASAAQQSAAQSAGAGGGPVTRSVWDGVYTLAQARRGALKSGLCVECHGDGFLGGPAPELAGPAFASSWNGRTVGDLFDLIRLTMPDDDPGALSREVYADLVAYILAVNKYPAGATEVGTDSSVLKLIRIEPKP